jgi:hypothetical protein
MRRRRDILNSSHSCARVVFEETPWSVSRHCCLYIHCWSGRRGCSGGCRYSKIRMGTFLLWISGYYSTFSNMSNIKRLVYYIQSPLALLAAPAIYFGIPSKPKAEDTANQRRSKLARLDYLGIVTLVSLAHILSRRVLIYLIPN